MFRKISNFLNEKNIFLNKRDYLTIGIILLFYTIFSFINLGTLTNPQTFYNFQENENIIIDFKKPVDLIRVKTYAGRLAGTYYLYTSNDNITYHYLKTIKSSGAFAWDENKILKKVQYLKIYSSDESTLGSISFYDNSAKMISVKKITSSILAKAKKTKFLTDEQNTIPKEINYLNSTYFDEVYFARFAYEYTHNYNVYDVHPPLGKLIEAIPIKLFNTMAPFYYRLMGNIAGIIMIFVMYLFGKALFKERKYALFSSLLMTFSTFHFAQSRMGTIDTFLVLFIMLSIYFMYQYIVNAKTRNLFYSGLFIGLAISTKWSAMYAGLFLAIIFFIETIKNKRLTKKLILKCLVFFILMPLIVYLLSYFLFPNVGTYKAHNFAGIIKEQERMYQYHSTLKATHPFASKWYTWPICYRPVWYYTSSLVGNNRGTIVGIGNIAIWWFSIIAFLYLLISFFRKKDLNTLYLILTILCLLLPYAFIDRIMFLYHYFPTLPFMMLGIVYLFKDLNTKLRHDYFMYIYLLLVIVIFILYYPVVSGNLISQEYINGLKLLSSWIF